MNNPRIGVGILVIRDEKVLLGKRKTSHGNGTWAPPGGHLEFGESPQECAARELMEETGMTAARYFVGPYTNDLFEQDNKHYITLYMIADGAQGNPGLMEPDKCFEWGWFSFDELPEPQFLCFTNLLANGFSLTDIYAIIGQPAHAQHTSNLKTEILDSNAR